MFTAVRVASSAVMTTVMVAWSLVMTSSTAMVVVTTVMAMFL